MSSYQFQNNQLLDLKSFQYLFVNESQEQAIQTVGSPMQDNPLAATILLMQLAELRLKSQRRLVFWLPTVSFVSTQQVEESMQQLAQIASPSLKMIRCAVEELSNGIWRFLCVFEKQ